jgi:hypothetical protein
MAVLKRSDAVKPSTISEPQNFFWGGIVSKVKHSQMLMLMPLVCDSRTSIFAAALCGKASFFVSREIQVNGGSNPVAENPAELR